MKETSTFNEYFQGKVQLEAQTSILHKNKPDEMHQG